MRAWEAWKACRRCFSVSPAEALAKGKTRDWLGRKGERNEKREARNVVHLTQGMWLNLLTATLPTALSTATNEKTRGRNVIHYFTFRTAESNTHLAVRSEKRKTRPQDESFFNGNGADQKLLFLFVLARHMDDHSWSSDWARSPCLSWCLSSLPSLSSPWFAAPGICLLHGGNDPMALGLKRLGQDLVGHYDSTSCHTFFINPVARLVSTQSGRRQCCTVRQQSLPCLG